MELGAYGALVLCVVSSAGFAHVMRAAQHFHRHMLWVGAANYCVATIACAAGWVLQEGAAWRWQALLLGSLAGVALVSLYFLLDVSFRVSGVGISQCMGRLSVAIPVAVSVLCYADRFTWARGAGFVLVLVSVPLLTMGKALKKPMPSRWNVPILFVVFAANGAVSVCFKVYAQCVGTGHEQAFLVFMFAVASVVTLAAAIRTRRRPQWGDLAHGFFLGLTNVGSNFGKARAIALLTGPVFFPTESAATIVLSTFVAWTLWKERFNKSALAGIIMAVVAVILIMCSW